MGNANMKIEPIPGFKALKFKDEAQARVQEELEGLSPEERIRKINDDIEHGPFADWWRRVKDAKLAKAKVGLEPREKDQAA